MRCLNTLLCGICVVMAAWIVVAYANDTVHAADDVSTYRGEDEAESPTPVEALIEIPDFPDLRAMPLRNMLAPAVSEREQAIQRHQQLLTDARRRNTIAAMEQPVVSSRRNGDTSSYDRRRRERELARRAQSSQSQQKYDRRTTTVFERTRHYEDNRYAYQYSNTNGLTNSRLSNSRRRGLRVPVPTSRRR